MPSKSNVCMGSLRHKRCGSKLETRGYLSEAKRATHDGHIWPVGRPRMADTNQIAIRMAEDATGLIRERGADAVITIDDFLRWGWTIDQVRRVGGAAMDLIQVGESTYANAA